MVTWIILAVQLASFNLSPTGRHHQYHWIKALEKGTGREEAGWQEGTWPRIYVEVVVQRDTLLMIGSSRTWKSADGIHWRAFPHNGKWGKRYGASYTLFRDKIWLIGGMKTWDDFANDVWSSEDGLRWTLITGSAPWRKRRGHATIVHDGMMWIIGGAESSGKPDVLPKGSLGDVWKTADGKAWELVVSNAPWQTEFSKEYFNTTTSGHQFNDALWVIGGPRENCVWQSSDGVHWTMVVGRAAWPTGYARGTAVYDHKLWVFGGADLNDVWFSSEGKTWEQLTPNAPWSPRAPGPVVVFNNRIWMFGGKTGRSNDHGDDVWYLESNTRYPQ